MRKMDLSRLNPLVRFLGKCIDELYDIKALLQCQSDSLLGLAQHHSDNYHHLILNYVIIEKLSETYNGIESQLSKLNKNEILK